MGSSLTQGMTIDANIVIAYLNGDEQVEEVLTSWRRVGRILFLSTVAEAEVLAFRDWSDEERRATELFLEENFTSIPFDRATARLAAQIRLLKVKLPDAAIAATALFTHTPLVTRNQRDFARIPGLRIVTI